MATTGSGSPNPTPQNNWENDPITAGSTKVKVTHIRKLREFLESMDGHSHTFGSVESDVNPDITTTWTDASLQGSTTKIRKVHIDELRTAITQLDNHTHSATLGEPLISRASDAYAISPSFTDPTITADVTKIRKDHIQELRTICNALKYHTHTICCDAECPCECECTCTCTEECCSQCWAMD